MAFAVEQESFSGPLKVLLGLLDQKELEIKDVALASIADDYLNYLDQNEVLTEEMADFLLIASRLIYLKSRELMPYLQIDEEDEQIASLEDQLRLYRMFIESAEKLESMFGSAAILHRRPFVKIKPVLKRSEFVAPENATVDNLKNSFEWILKKLAPFFALQQASIERIKSVEERLGELRGAISSRAKMSFQDVIKGAQSKPEVVVSFLALLELVRRQVVKVSQKSDHDIIIERL